MPIDLGNLCFSAPERPAGHHYLVSLDEALAHLDNMRLRRGKRPNPVDFLVTQGKNSSPALASIRISTGA